MTKAQCVSKPVFHRIGVIVSLRKLAYMDRVARVRG